MAEKNILNQRPWILISGYVFVVGLLFLAAAPNFSAKRKTFAQDRTVALALSFEDLQRISHRENKLVADIFHSVRELQVDHLMFPASGALVEERMVRENGFKILWNQDEPSGRTVAATLARFQVGDGVLPQEDFVFGYPGYLKEVVEAILQKQGFLPIVEFGPNKGLSRLMGLSRGRWIKTHILFLEETLDPKFDLWKARLIRAVSERGMRLLIVRLSPAASFDQSQNFLMDVSAGLKAKGFSVGEMKPFEWGGQPSGFDRIRKPVIFLLALLGPLTSLFAARKISAHPAVVFCVACGISLMTGLCLNAWGSVPDMIFGQSSIRGVKILLVLPLLVGFWSLLSSEEQKKLLETNIKVKHLLFGGFFLGLIGGLYLMRSGNFPLLKVSDSERMVRNGLENWFGARPRFKEIFFGHVLFIFGLFLQRKSKFSSSFLSDGRLFLLLGLIGQISIVNTFMHFHIPVEWGILRTFHGVWMGLLFSLPLVWGLPKLIPQERFV